MLRAIRTYATRFKDLFLDESLFNTLAIKNNLQVKVIPELYSIVYRQDWKLADVDLDKLYHPVKHASEHQEWHRHFY